MLISFKLMPNSKDDRQRQKNMKKLKNLSFLLLAIMVFTPILATQAQEEELVNKPVYTKRFVVSSCKALSNAERNSRNITRLTNVVNQLDRQIIKLGTILERQVAAEADTTDIQNLLNTRNAQKVELEAFIASLQGDEVPTFCHEIYQKQTQAEIVKNERALAREANRAKSLQARLDSYNTRMEVSVNKIDEQINTLEAQIPEVADARRQAAQEKRLEALKNRKNSVETRVETYNTRVETQIAVVEAKVESYQGVIEELKAQSQTYRANNGNTMAKTNGMPAAHNMTGQEFGAAVNTLANSAPGAVANHVAPKDVPTEPEQPEQPEMMATMAITDMPAAGAPAAHETTGQEFGEAVNNSAQTDPQGLASHVSGQTVPAQPEQPEKPTKPTLPVSPNKPVK